MSSRQRLSVAGAALLLMASVFIAALIGIYSRPVGFVAQLWLANAVMLGLLIRVPQSVTLMGWCAGMAGFFAADLLTGSSLIKTLILNTANFISIAVAYGIYSRLPDDIVRLRAPTAMLSLAGASAAAACGAGLVGAYANPLLFGGDALTGWWFWFAAEFVNYIAFLPLILSVPGWTNWPDRKSFHRSSSFMPAIVLFILCLAAAVVGGPGAIAFAVPALLWCGLNYSVFVTALLTFLFSIWALVVISSGFTGQTGVAADEMTIISLRLGISFVAITPLVIACVMASHRELLSRLNTLASRDPLTGTHNRRSFQQQVQQRISNSNQPMSLLMIDLDHFKRVNDSYGHAVGDMVLTNFTSRVSHCLRSDDLIGRLGGEEFAVFLSDCDHDTATMIAERIRNAVAISPVALSDGTVISVTASIGLTSSMTCPSNNIEHLLAQADRALYRAKDLGRNRVEHAASVL